MSLAAYVNDGHGEGDAQSGLAWFRSEGRILEVVAQVQ